jgi:hypothetical protein
MECNRSELHVTQTAHGVQAAKAWGRLRITALLVSPGLHQLHGWIRNAGEY